MSTVTVDYVAKRAELLAQLVLTRRKGVQLLSFTVGSHMGIDLIAQLPLRIGERLRGLPPGPDKSITAEGILAELSERLGVESVRAIEVLDAVVKTLDANVSAGQMQDVRHQLPKDLRSVFTLAER